MRVLQPGGLLLTLDRIAVDAPGLYGCYQALWARMDRLSGSQVYAHEGMTPADHKRIKQERGDIPLGLRLHLKLLAEVGFEAACLDLATNCALIAARKV